MTNTINTQILQLGNEYSNAGTYYGITNDGYNAFGERLNAQASQRNNLKRMHGNTFEGWLGDNLNLFRDGDDYSRHNLNEEMRLRRDALLSALEAGINGDASAKTTLAKFGLELDNQDLDAIKPQLIALKTRIEASKQTNRPSLDMDAFSKGGRDRLYTELSELQKQYKTEFEAQQKQGILDTQTLTGLEAVDTTQNLSASFKTHLQQSIQKIQEDATQQKGDLGNFNAWATKLQQGVAKHGNGESGKAMRTATHDIMGQLNQRLQDLAQDGKSPQDILKAAFRGEQPEILAYIRLHQRLVGADLPRNAQEVQAKLAEKQVKQASFWPTQEEIKTVKGAEQRMFRLARADNQSNEQVSKAIEARQKRFLTLGGGQTLYKGSDDKLYLYDTDVNNKTGVQTTEVSQINIDEKTAKEYKDAKKTFQDTDKRLSYDATIYSQKVDPKDKVKKGDLYATKVNYKDRKAVKERREEVVALATKADLKDSSASASAPATSTSTNKSPFNWGSAGAGGALGAGISAGAVALATGAGVVLSAPVSVPIIAGALVTGAIAGVVNSEQNKPQAKLPQQNSSASASAPAKKTDATTTAQAPQAKPEPKPVAKAPTPSSPAQAK